MESGRIITGNKEVGLPCRIRTLWSCLLIGLSYTLICALYVLLSNSHTQQLKYFRYFNFTSAKENAIFTTVPRKLGINYHLTCNPNLYKYPQPDFYRTKENLTNLITVPRKLGGNVYYHFTSNPNVIEYPQSTKDEQLQNVTLVSAFFNIGTFAKGGGNFTKKTYTDWVQRFLRVDSYLVFYTDDDELVKLFSDIHSKHLNTTKVVKLNRKDVWAFSLRHRISSIYSNASYPKYKPNTVNPDYTCAMHAKYDAVQLAMESNYFKTKYFAWIDTGYFREFNVTGDIFTLGLPPAFDNRTVAFNEVYAMTRMKTYDIFRGNNVWVGGGFFLGYHSVLLSFIHQYRAFVEKCLTQGLSDTDQQNIYAMYHEYKGFEIKQPVQHDDIIPLQLYKAQGPGDVWFYLGKLCIQGRVSLK